MKNIIICICLFCLGFLSRIYGQNTSKNGYLSYFGNDSTTITIGHVPCDWDDGSLILAGKIYSRDTIRINGKLYLYSPPKQSLPVSNHQIDFDIPREDTLFLREETETGRLYRFYRNYFGQGEQEKLICDMSLQLGDTIVLPSGHCLNERDFIVFDIIEVNGKKTIYLNGAVYENVFVEGQFPLKYPLWQEPLPEIGGIFYEMQSASWSIMLCEYKDDVHVYEHPDYGCYGYNPWQIDELEDDLFSVRPNILQNSETLTIEAPASIKDVRIYDVTGRELSLYLMENNDKLWRIRISQYCRCGMYYIAIKTEKGCGYEKIIVIG